MRTRTLLLAPLLLSTSCATVSPKAQAPDATTAEAKSPAPERPFGTLREQAKRQQAWLAERVEKALPQLMRQYGVDMWVIPMREYNEDPVFKALVSPTSFAARRRTIYVFFDRGPEQGVERLALGGGSQGGLYTPRRAQRQVDGGGVSREAELWGPEQWQVLKQVVEERQPKRIALNVSRTFAFADGLSHGEYEGMSEALGPDWVKRFTSVDGLAVDFIAWRSADEARFYEEQTKLAWNIIETAFSNQVITPGVTTTRDVEWWMRQRLADLGLETWFQPSVDLQRQGVTEKELGEDPIIQRGDVLHCDYGVTALGLNTDTQHMGYVLREGGDGRPRRAEGRAEDVQPAAGHRLRGAASRSHGQRHPPHLPRADARRGHRRHRVLASHRPARPRRRPHGGAVGPAGGRARQWRPQGDCEPVVLHRTPGHVSGAGVERPAGALGTGRGHHHRRRGPRALGLEAPDGLPPGALSTRPVRHGERHHEGAARGLTAGA